MILLIVVFAGAPLFTDNAERALLLLVIGTAHFSQFAFNLPVIKAGERKNIALWPVRSGPMLFIFVMDIAQALLCLVAIGFILSV